MALTLEAEQRLERVGLIRFFEKDKKVWCGVVKRSYDFTRQEFPEGTEIRYDDVAKAIVPVLEINQKLSKFLNTGKLNQKYWRLDFADLIIDRCWSEITQGGLSK